jgi:hypothetical protein
MDKNKSAAKEETAPRKKRGQISPPSFLILHDVWIRGDKNANDSDLNELLSLSLSGQAGGHAKEKKGKGQAKQAQPDPAPGSNPPDDEGSRQ